MSNSNLISTKNRFITILKNIFNRLFNKQDNSKVYLEGINNKVENGGKTTSFINELKENINIENAEAKEILKYTIEMIEQNPELLDDFTVEKLKEIKEYYDGQILKMDLEISKIKKINNM